MNIKIFAARLKELRETNKLTQAELADKVGCSVTYICFLEQGKKAPSVMLLYAIADFLNVSMDFLVGR